MNLLGGRAGFNSVTFESETHSATATRNGKNIIVVKNIKESKETKLDNFLNDIPFIRAYWLIFKIFTIKSGLIYFTVCLFLSYIIHKIKIVPSTPMTIDYNSLILMLIILVLINKFTKIKYYHGAEHKVANDFEKNGKASINTSMKESCVNDDCGTNLFVGLIIITTLLFPIFYFWSGLLGWGLNYEIMRSDNRIAKIIVKPIYFIGNILQKYIFTSEPSRDQLEVAIRALKELE